MQPAQLGIDLHRGHMRMSQPPAEQRIHQQHGELHIDQTRAWDALGKPKPAVFMERIANQSWGIAAAGVRKIVQTGNKLAAIHEHRNVFAEIGQAVFPLRGQGHIQYTAQPSMDHVKITYTAHRPVIEHMTHEPIINIEPNRVELYMKQWPELEIIPPQLDVIV